MRTYILLPLLALINMGANAATIHNHQSRHSGPLIRSPSNGLVSHTGRQVHNADFSSDSSGPISGSQSPSEAYSSADGSTPAPSSDIAPLRRSLGRIAARAIEAAEPESDAILLDGNVDDQSGDLDVQNLDPTSVSVYVYFLS